MEQTLTLALRSSQPTKGDQQGGKQSNKKKKTPGRKRRAQKSCWKIYFFHKLQLLEASSAGPVCAYQAAKIWG